MARAARKTAVSKPASEGKSAPAAKKSLEGQGDGGLKKQYLKSQKCKVTFTLPAKAAPDATNVMLVGEFNNWDETATPMKKMKDGRFQITLTLDPGQEYRFRYLIDGQYWENDWAADRYEPGPFSCDNSVVVV